MLPTHLSRLWFFVHVCVSKIFRNFFKLYRRSLQTIYFSFIRPLLEFADVVRDTCTQYEVNDFEKIQNEAARVVNMSTTKFKKKKKKKLTYYTY